ncbi:hypothetical protein [Psychrobacter pygoscelis]|uniref:hypothetical protein n=1 Tax=Psychrobacter pygoscelis TaxID=2488563 RepID=UPI00103E3BCB|nr:hypothetical protein [Psychrobacter pygoscelis]
MLKLTNDGAHIILKGQYTPKGDGMFWFAAALLIGAVGVAMAMSLLSERLAIGALALLIVGCFIFNRQRQQQKKQAASHICDGVLEVQAGSFIHKSFARQNQVVIDTNDRIEVSDTELMIMGSDNQQKYVISGFESPKEVQVMQAVLKGQQFGKRHANIKMQSN